MSATPLILCIDDSATVRKLLQMTLASHRVEVASTGREGIDAARRIQPDVVLLDFMLPDMKGHDVCAALEADERTANIPVILLSGKSREELQSLFRDRRSVAEVLTKPFSGPQLQEAVTSALRRRAAQTNTQPGGEPVGTELTAGLTREKKLAAARTIFGVLRDRLSRIPEWSGQIGAEPPAMFYAKRILTEDIVEKLIADLAEFLRPLGAGDGPASPLAGSVSLMSVEQVIRTLQVAGRTGVLSLRLPDAEVLVYIRRGEIFFVTDTLPDPSVRQAMLGADPTLRQTIEKAEAEQKKTGKPVYVSLAEAGTLGVSELPDLLYEHGRKTLSRVLLPSGSTQTFRWSESAAIPAYAEAYGRSYRVRDIELEALREADDRLQVESFVSSMDTLFERAENFSLSVRELSLTDTERKVLTLVNGRAKLAHIVERSGEMPFEVFRILYRAAKLGLVRKVGSVGGTGPAPVSQPKSHSPTRSRPVMVVDPDRDGLVRPLESLLLRRYSLSTVDATGEPDLVARMVREHPKLVLLSVGEIGSAPATGTAVGIDPVPLLRQIHSTLEISDTLLAVACPPELADRALTWRSAGVNAVLVKPFHFSELEALLCS